MAWLGQAAAQAGTISPSRTGRSSPLARMLHILDALHAEGALLHDAAGTHGHLGVVDEALGLGLVGGELQEVEAAHLVGAVVGAVAGAHAAVVGHLVEAVGAVVGGVHRADVLAGRVVAVLAEHGLMDHPGVLLARPRSSGRCGSSASRGPWPPARGPPWARCSRTGRPARRRCSRCRRRDR